MTQMAESIQAMRERRNALAKEARNLHENTPATNWDDKAQGQYNDLMEQIGRVEAAIKREQETLDLHNERQAEDAIADRASGNKSAVADALRAFAKGGLSGLNPEQMREMRARQTPEIQNAMSTSTSSEGGYTVATEYMKRLEEALKQYGGMRQVATVIQTATGATMNFPTADSTSEVGEIVGQNSAVSGADTTFGNIALDVYKYSSKKIALPWELIQDSFLDIEGYILEVLARRIGRLQNTHFTTGDGSSKPYGLATGASAGVTAATGHTSDLTYANLVDLVHSVDPAYRGNAKWMMKDSTVQYLRKIVDGQSRPIFVPGYETGVPGGAPDTLLGQAVIVNQDMAALGASNKAVLYGDFSKYVIRDVMDLTLFRMTDSAFTLNGQVGFVGFQRSGGRLIDVGGAVKAFVNSAT
jgi:HK97 family phage major capsid protein